MSAKNHKNSVRIIGGKWRGKKIKFPANAPIRPTPDRVRETLFNWLAPMIREATCLDVFAGSGILGIEALSRGASKVTLLERSPSIIEYLQKLAGSLETSQLSIRQHNIPDQIKLAEKFNIVFIDPPFKQDLVAVTCQWLEDNDLLSNNAYIYIEAEKTLSTLLIPNAWKILKAKTAGQVAYYLVTN